MKRLIKKASSITLYHGTSAQRLSEMINSGEIGTDLYGENSGESNVVYLTDSKGTAERYGSNVIRYSTDKFMPDWTIVLEINVDTSNLKPDMDDWNISGGNRRENSNPTWEESLDELSQVMYDGKIPISQITKVHNFIENNMNVEINNCEILLGISFNEAINFLNEEISNTSTLNEFIAEWNILEHTIENEDVDW